MTGPFDASPVRGRITAAGPTVFVFLSLYLILLTFFIMLAATSRSEHRKVQLTLFGLEATFRGGPDRAVLFGGGGRNEGPIRQPIERALAGAIEARGLAGAVAFVNRGEDVAIELPLATIFATSGFEPRTEGLTLLQELISAGRSGGPASVSVSLPMAPGATEAGPEQVTRAHALAARLASLGIEIGIGFERRDNEGFRFVVRPAEDPR